LAMDLALIITLALMLVHDVNVMHIVSLCWGHDHWELLIERIFAYR